MLEINAHEISNSTPLMLHLIIGALLKSTSIMLPMLASSFSIVLNDPKKSSFKSTKLGTHKITSTSESIKCVCSKYDPKISSFAIGVSSSSSLMLYL